MGAPAGFSAGENTYETKHATADSLGNQLILSAGDGSMFIGSIGTPRTVAAAYWTSITYQTVTAAWPSPLPGTAA